MRGGGISISRQLWLGGKGRGIDIGFGSGGAMLGSKYAIPFAMRYEYILIFNYCYAVSDPIPR